MSDNRYKNHNLIMKLNKERDEIYERIEKLSVFITTEQFKTLTKRHQDLLYTQFSILNSYVMVLTLRIDDLLYCRKDMGENIECAE